MFPPRAETDAVTDARPPHNTDAKRAIDGVTLPQRPLRAATGGFGTPTISPPTVRPPGDHGCRPLPHPMSLTVLAIVFLGALAAMHAGAGFMALREVRRAGEALPRLLGASWRPNGVLELLGADLGVVLFWLVLVALPITVMLGVERITNKVWIALGFGLSLGIAQIVFGAELGVRMAGWPVDALQWDPRGFGVASFPEAYGLAFVVTALSVFAGRKGDGLVLLAALALALWLGWELADARNSAWGVVLEDPLRRAGMGIGSGDQLTSARLYLGAASDWLHLRTVGDILWLVSPAWIVGGATR